MPGATMPSNEMEFHPCAGIFPFMEGAAFAELATDIEQRGLAEPIVLHEEKILDGRNRYRACIRAGVTPRFRKYEGGDPLAYVISANLKRRHLNEGQRAFVAAKIATLGHGQTKTGKFAALRSQADAAALLNVSERSVRDAVAVRDHAAPELAAALEQGHLPVSIAAKSAKLPKADQREIARRAAAGEINAARKVAKQKVRDANEKRLGAKQMALPEKRYGVILADPPWQIRMWSAAGQANTSAENHYPTLPLSEIKALNVASISAPDCALFLWSTTPMLPAALEVMAAWGFQYKSKIVWVKNRPGTGYWVRDKHEDLLLGTKGNVPAPAPGKQWESVFEAPKRRHSEKPELSLKLIESYFPTLPKIELNRRGPARPGWDAWGLEVVADAGDRGSG